MSVKDEYPKYEADYKGDGVWMVRRWKGPKDWDESLMISVWGRADAIRQAIARGSWA